MERPQLGSIALWENHKQRVLEIFEEALLRLVKRGQLPSKEVLLNRELHRLVKRVNNELLDKGGGINGCIPVPNCPMGPDSDSEEAEEYEEKKPDFQWGFVDGTEKDYGKREKIFCIECKRLGFEKSIWSRRYVENGVKRFLSKTHQYGRGVNAGAMVGYVQGMRLEAIISEISDLLRQNIFKGIVLADKGWKKGGISAFVQELDRMEVRPRNFRLHHLWADLRKN